MAQSLDKSFAEALLSGTKKRMMSSPLESANKIPTLDDDIPDNIRNDISEQMVRISALGNETYIPNAPVNARPTYQAASEVSFGSSWNKGLTDIIQLEFCSINGQQLQASVARPEVFYVWSNVLKLDTNLIFGVSFKKPINKNLIASIKLKNKVQIDDLIMRPDFSYNKGKQREDGSFDIITGRVLGLKTLRPPPMRHHQQPKPDFTRVNVYGLNFEISKGELELWLSKFGEVLNYEDIMDRELPTCATGDLSVRMKLRKDIPCFLPMYGKKIRIAYRGMPTLCANCFGQGHIRNECTSTRVTWIDFIKNIRKVGIFEDHLFGSWIDIINRQKQAPKQPTQLETIEETTEQTPMTQNPKENINVTESDADQYRGATNTTTNDERDTEKEKTNEEDTDDNQSMTSAASLNRSFIGTIKGIFTRK